MPFDLDKILTQKKLLFSLVRQEIIQKYVQTHLGVFLSVFQASFALVVTTLFFSVFIGIEAPGMHYVIFVIPGIMTWYYFSYIIAYSGTALFQSAQLIRTTSFPRILFPLAKALAGIVDYLVWIVVLIIAMIYFGEGSWTALAMLPLVFILTFIAGITVSLLLNISTYRYRDLQFVVPFVIGFGIFITPVFVPVSMIPAEYFWVVFLNPVAGIIELFRASFNELSAFRPEYFWGFGIMIIFFTYSIYLFYRHDPDIADYV